SRFVQVVDLDLAGYAGRVPEEVFGHTRFPVLGERPLSLTIGPHGFYWLNLRTVETRQRDAPWVARHLDLSPEWSRQLFDALAREVLPAYFATCRWFG